MPKDKSAPAGDAVGGGSTGSPAKPPVSVRNNHTASLVIAGLGLADKGRSVELKPRAAQPVDADLWAEAKERPSVQGWLKKGLLVEEA